MPSTPRRGDWSLFLPRPTPGSPTHALAIVPSYCLPGGTFLAGSIAIAGDELPGYMRNVVAPSPMPTPKAVAVRDALALVDQMQVIYSDSVRTYKKENCWRRAP